MFSAEILSRLGVKGATAIGGSSSYAGYLLVLDTNGLVPSGAMSGASVDAASINAALAGGTTDLSVGRDITAGRNLVVNGNLTVNGSTTTITSSTLDIGDNIIVLNSGVTSGTPTVNAGIKTLRGSSTAASLIWNESTDKWQAGLLGSEDDLVLAAGLTSTLGGYVTLTGSQTVTNKINQAADGDGASSLSFSFASEPNSGFYRQGVGNFGINVTGANVISFQNGRVFIYDGNQLITNHWGTASSPSFAWNGATTSGIYYANSGGTDHQVIITTNGSNKLLVTDTSVTVTNVPLLLSAMAAPATAQGKIYFDSTLLVPEVYNGTNWLPMAGQHSYAAATLGTGAFSLTTTTEDHIYDLFLTGATTGSGCQISLTHINKLQGHRIRFNVSFDADTSRLRVYDNNTSGTLLLDLANDGIGVKAAWNDFVYTGTTWKNIGGAFYE